VSRIRTVASTEVLLIIGLTVFVLGAQLVERALGIDEPITVGKPVAVLMAAVPAALWLVYFYVQDRLEPEPKHFVFGAYVLGAFVAAPLSEFAIELAVGGAGDGAALRPFSTARVVELLLVVGIAQELGKYMVVRYGVYLSAEFDEPMDGIIYMTAAGIGFATHENYQYLQGLDGTVFIGTGAANAVVTTLAHACFAGVQGYAMGVAKFSPGSALRRSLVLLGGLMVAALLNGQFTVLEDLVKTTGLQVRPWRGVVYAAGFAAAVLFATSVLMRRHLATSPHHPDGAGDSQGEGS